jgi:RNA 2',3'-cyclic 3'-phosphodiesterase
MMRLFYAIECDRASQNMLQKAAAELKNESAGGRWTRPENYHLTLAFLGEQPEAKLSLLASILDETVQDAKPFDLAFSGWGTFGRKNDILWIDVTADPELYNLVQRLRDLLNAHQLPAEDRPYQPHLTIARQIRIPPGYSPNWTRPPVRQTVRDIVLMESLRVQNRLVYQVRYRASFGPDSSS